jgi:hypothetical protein
LDFVGPPEEEGFKFGEEVLGLGEEAAARKAIQLEKNITVGRLGERIVTAELNYTKKPDEIVFEQVTGIFEDGTTTTYDNVVYNEKTRKVVFTNETKTGGSFLSDQQLKALAGHKVTFGPSAPPQLQGLKISSETTPFKITRLNFLTGEIHYFW